MQTIHIPETEAARNFAALMAHISAGSEVVIERNASVIAVMRPPAKRPGLLLSEMLTRAQARGSKATLDGNFGRDLEDAVNSHPESMDAPEWD